MKKLFKHIKSVVVLEKELLLSHTSFHIGGPADYFIKVYSLRALKSVLEPIKERKLDYLILGAGTNVLFSDQGFRGVVIKLEGYFKKIKHKANIFTCGAGVRIDQFIIHAAALGFGGAEFLAGIPGTVGGAIKGNAGAFGHSIAEIVKKIIVFDTVQLQKKELTKEQVNFGYRFSTIKNNMVITAVVLELKARKAREIKKEISAIKARRQRRQPDGYSAGSFFKNPPQMSAGKLIEECGLCGLRSGDAEISKKHGNWIINLGKAKAQDVITLARIVKKTVFAQKGIRLKEEVKILR